MNAQSFGNLDSVRLKIIRAKITDRASHPDHLAEVGQDPPAIRKPSGTDLAGVESARLEREVAIDEILDRVVPELYSWLTTGM